MRLALPPGGLAGALLAVGCASTAPAPAPAPASLATAAFVIRDVTLIDGTGADARPGMSLLISGDRIVDVGPTAAVGRPAGARVIEAAGRYAIPGLWDMHVHLSKAKAEALPVLVANGITAVRDMGGDLDELLAWRQRIVAGTLVGPRMKLADPMFEAPATVERLRGLQTHERWTVTRVPVPDSAAAAVLVDSVASLGIDFIKIREAVSPTVYAAVVRAAHDRGLAVAGHAPFALDPIEGAALSVASFEHASYPYPLDTAAAARGRIIDAFRRHHVVMVPTLMSWQVSLMDVDSVRALIDDSTGQRDPRRRLISTNLADEWRFDVAGDKRKSDASLRGWQGFYDRMTADLRVLHEAGVPMVPGSDLAGPAIFPGYALHDELENMVRQVGLTPMQALVSATRGPAEFLGVQDELGTVERGKLADIVLLSADPLADITNTRRIVGVVARGRYFDEQELATMLGGLSAATRGSIDLMQHPGSPR